MTEQRLRSEIAVLEGILSETVEQLAGEKTINRVQLLRELANARRQGVPGAEQEMVAAVDSIPLERIEDLIRAFGFYFDLANLAEDRHRVRVLREREREGELADKPRPESIEFAIAEMSRIQMSAESVQELLDRLLVEPVFTAHPTEAKRKSLREKIRDLREHLHELDGVNLTERERNRLIRELSADLAVLWQTDLLRERRPTVLEELERSLFFFETLWRVVPELYRDLTEALDRYYPGHRFSIPSFLRFGTWIGGDRDGNPNVTWEITSKAMWRLRQFVLASHYRQCRKMRRSLSQSVHNTAVSERLLERLEWALQRWPNVEELVRPIAPTEIYRRFLRTIQWRLERSQSAEQFQPEPEGAYTNAQEFLADLHLIRDSLSASAGGPLHVARMDTWVRQTEVFGFHAMRMDVRQESGWYHEVMGELLKVAGVTDRYDDLNEEERQQILSDSLNRDYEIDIDSLSPNTQETARLFQLLAETVRLNGPDVLGCHIISMTKRPSDVLVAKWLGNWAARKSKLPGGRLPIPIVPLFETIEDLNSGGHSLDTILRHPAYREQVSLNGDQQIVMIGYSDSTKDGGYLAACWAQYRGQAELAETAKRHGVRAIFFHGRGGALGRGGGPAARSVMSSPVGTINGAMRVTEQGEVMSARYDDPQITRRHLEQIISSTMLITACPSRSPEPRWMALMDDLAQRAYKKYRSLVTLPGFISFFEQASPIAEIEGLPIGSRPARRTAERSLTQLRAIPWVFSWTQNRILLPAWYGTGTALSSFINEPNEGLEELVRLYREWPFFNGLIENAALALAKADIGIARMYTGLVADPQVRGESWDRLLEDFELSRQAILQITERSRLMEHVPWLRESIENRNPFVDPLNLIQIRLLQDVRGLPDTDEKNSETSAGIAEREENLRELIRLSIQAIAAGLRTTG